MVIYCDVCQTSVPSDGAMLQHLKGKRHLKNVKNVDLRDKQKRCSVFVRGFPPCVEESEIQNYFAAYGNILKYYFDNNRKHFAIIEYSSDEVAQQVIKCRNHSLNGYTMVAKEREGKPLHYKNSPSTSHHQLKAKANSKAKKKKLKVEKEKLEAKEGDMDGLKDRAMTAMFEQATNISDQMCLLKESMALTQTDFEERNSICQILLDVLKPYFPGSTLNQFGSSVNGFGVKGCDLDLFLDFNDDKHDEEQHQQHAPIQLPYVRDISTLWKSCGPLYSSDLQQMSLYDKVRLVSRILCDKAAGCNQIFCIPSTRCPVVRFIHEPTGMKCDLSVNNRLALRNTQLLALYSNLDEKVKLLVFTIRYWAKLRKIAGNENAGPRLTNYALTLLVVYFLQNTSPPVLPSVKTLAELAEEKTIIDGWDCSFIEDVNNVSKTENTNSPAELLQKFFQFYSHVEFSAAVLQCKFAKPKLLTAFAEEMSSSNQLVNFKFGPISVQDPFVLEHNVTLNVNEKTKCKIVDQFRISSLMSSNWFPEDQSHAVTQEQWGLISMLSEELPHEFVDSTLEHPEDVIKCDDMYSFPIVFKMSMLSESAFQQLQTKGDYRYHWCLHVCSFLRKLMSDILLIDVQLESSSLRSPEEFLKAADEKSGQEPTTRCQTTETHTESCLASMSQSECNTKVAEDPEEVNYEASAKYVAGIIIDVNRSKRLSSDSLNESDSKRCRTCLETDVNLPPEDSTYSSISKDKNANQEVEVCESKNSFAKSCVDSGNKTGEVSEENKAIIADSVESVKGYASNEFGTLSWLCKSECATFNGRKTVRKETLLEGVVENLNLEKEVSKRILQKSEQIKFKLAFRCILKPVVEAGSTAVLLHFEPIENKKQFSCFYQFLKTFVIKMVDRYLFSSK